MKKSNSKSLKSLHGKHAISGEKVPIHHPQAIRSYPYSVYAPLGFIGFQETETETPDEESHEDESET